MSLADHPGRGRPVAVPRDAVVDAVVKLLRHEGPTGVTIRGVAAAVGVSRQVVYTQFGSLGGLVDVLYRKGFDGLRAAAGRHSRPASPARPRWSDTRRPTGGTRSRTRSCTR